jgi:hypothetical protein
MLLPALLFLLATIKGSVAVANTTALAPAAPSASVLSADGKARFTVLADQLLRMEFAPSGKFDDRQTLAIVNRKLPVPTFSHATVGQTLTIKTSALQLTYTSMVSGVTSAPIYAAPHTRPRTAEGLDAAS